MRPPLKYPGLRIQPAAAGPESRAFQSVRRFLREQFGRPTGFWGSLAGKVMALRASNQERIHWTLSLLSIRATDRLLEIGFGPGFAIEQAGRMAPGGFIAGVDHSAVMVRQATRRNAQAVRDGRVALRLGSASNVPTFGERFDKIFTINSIHFWDDPVGCLKGLRSVLKPRGVIAVTLQPRSHSATDTLTHKVGEEVAENLRLAGFIQVRLEVRKMKPVSAACALGINHNPAEDRSDASGICLDESTR